MLNALASLVAALVALFAVWLGAKLTEFRSYREKNWDRKAGSYAEVFSAISEMKVILEKWFDLHVQNKDQSDEEECKERDTYRSLQKQLNSVLAREQWSLPDVVVEVLDQLQVDLHQRHETWFDDLDFSIGACRSAIRDLTILARRDMAGKQTSWEELKRLRSPKGLK